jgi:hypothetical protein
MKIKGALLKKRQRTSSKGRDISGVKEVIKCCCMHIRKCHNEIIILYNQ